MYVCMYVYIYIYILLFVAIDMLFLVCLCYVVDCLYSMSDVIRAVVLACFPVSVCVVFLFLVFQFVSFFSLQFQISLFGLQFGDLHSTISGSVIVLR